MQHEDHAPDFHAEAVQCHACRTRAETAAKFADQKPRPGDGVYFTVQSDRSD